MVKLFDLFRGTKYKKSDLNALIYDNSGRIFRQIWCCAGVKGIDRDVTRFLTYTAVARDSAQNIFRNLYDVALIEPGS